MLKLADLNPNKDIARLYISYNGMLATNKSFGMIDDVEVSEDAENVYIKVKQDLDKTFNEKYRMIYFGVKYTRPYAHQWPKTMIPLWFHKQEGDWWVGSMPKKYVRQTDG